MSDPAGLMRQRDLAAVRQGTTMLNSGNLRRMADYCRNLARSRCSTEARNALLRMATLYDRRAAEEAFGGGVTSSQPAR